MTVLRGLAGGIGIGLIVVGLAFFLQLDFSDLVNAVVWMVGGVVGHDAVLAPAVLVVAVLAAMFLPSWAKAPTAVGAVILVSVTITAIPVLGRFGAKPTDHWLLDKPYLQSWFGFVALVIVGVVVASLVLRRRAGTARPE